MCKGTWADLNGCKFVVVSTFCRRVLERFVDRVRANDEAHIRRISEIRIRQSNDTYDDNDPYRHRFTMLFLTKDLKLPTVNISNNAIDSYTSCELSAMDSNHPSDALMVIPNSVCLSASHEQIPNSNQFCAIDSKPNSNNTFYATPTGLGLLCKEHSLSEAHLVGILMKKIRTNYWPSIKLFFEFANLNKVASQMKDICIEINSIKNKTTKLRPLT